MELINLTPHTLFLHTNGYYSNEVFALHPAGPAPRLVEETVPAGVAYHEGVAWPVTEVSLGQADNLPDPHPGVGIVVSQLVCLAYPHRRDLYYPYPLVRDDSGRIIGASGLGQVPAN